MRLTALLVLLALPALAAPLRLEGSVLDSEGRPPRAAVVQLEPLSATPLNVLADRPSDAMGDVQPDGKGRFALELPGPGAWRVWVRAPGHEGHGIPLFVTESTQRLPRVTVRLGRAKPIAWLGTPAVWLDVKPRVEPVPMQQQPDGSWTYEGTSSEPEVRYMLRLLTAETPEYVPNPSELRTVFGRGGFSSVVAPQDGHFTVRFVPSELTFRGIARATVTFSPRDSMEEQVEKLSDRYRQTVEGIIDLLQREPEATRQQKVKDFSAPLAAELVALFRKKKTPALLRGLAAVMMLELPISPPKELQPELAAFLTPEALVWAALPPALQGRVSYRLKRGAEAEAFLQAVGERHPDRRVRAMALHARGAQAERDGRMEEAARLLRQVSADYSDLQDVQRALTRTTRKRTRVAGPPFPELAFRTLEGKAVDTASLRDRYTLLDFSATGCGACIHLIPQLAEVRRAFPEEQLRMVTLTLGAREEGLKELLAHQPPQPWEHVALPDSDAVDTQLTAWEVWHYPTLVLVGPDGKIVAVDPELRTGRESLLARVQALLPAAAVPSAAPRP